MDADKRTAVELFRMANIQRLVVEYQDKALSHLARFKLQEDHPLRTLVRHASTLPVPD